MKSFKAQASFPVEEMLKLFLVLLVAVGIVVLILGMSGSLGDIINQFCQAHPEICGAVSPESQNYITAKQSVTALTCAVNSVAQGSEWQGSPCSGEDCYSCDVYYSGVTPGTISAAGEDENGEDGKLEVECEEGDSTELGIVYVELTEGYSDQDYRLAARSKCQSVYGASAVEYATGNTEFIDGKYKRVYECWLKSMTCTVTNFQLPQEVTNKEAWIKGYGDPEFMVYWQKLPEEASLAWSGYGLWVENFFDIMFAWIGVGKIIKIGGKTIVYAAGKSAKRIGANALESIMTTKIGWRALHNYITLEAERDIAFKVAAGSAAKTISDNIGSIGAQRLAKRGIQLGTISVVAAYIDSLTAPYDYYSNSMVLKVPYIDPEDFNSPVWDGLIILSKTKEEFYMVSPCNADITIKSGIAKCGSYNYIFEDEVSGCEEPSESFSEDDDFCADTIQGNFPPNEEIPKRIKELDSREELFIYERIPDPSNRPDIFIDKVTDPVSETTFEFETIVSYVATSSGFIETEEHALKKIIYKKDDGTTAELHFIREGDTRIFRTVQITLSFEMKQYVAKHMELEVNDFEKTNCEGRTNFCDYLDGLDSIFFVQIEETITKENEDGEEVEETVKINRFNLHRNDKDHNYWVVFIDNNEDGYAESIGVERERSAGIIHNIETNILGIEPKVLLFDSDNNGEMNIMYVRDCLTNAEYVSFERNDIDDYNFCIAEETFVSKNIWVLSPVFTIAGAIIGTFIEPGAGTAAVAKVGFISSATIITAYRSYELAAGSTRYWPGIK